MNEMKCDVAIIGAGTAGLAAERAARKSGAKTLLLDDSFTGTTCATVGCMPSKLLIAAANAAQGVRRASMFGIDAQKPAVDGRAVMDRLRKERDAFVAATLKSIDKIPPNVRVQQRARFTDRTSLELGDGRRVLAKAIVAATGARPSFPKEFEDLCGLVLTNETVFELPALPQSIAVIERSGPGFSRRGGTPGGLGTAQRFRSSLPHGALAAIPSLKSGDREVVYAVQAALADPNVSATSAPRAPMGFDDPSVVSRAV